MQTGNFINGEFRAALSGATDDVVAPATGEVIATVASSGAADVHAAVAGARAAFETWSETTPRARFEMITALADAIEETVAGVDHAIAGLPPAVRAEIAQLFALLALAPGRRVFAGVASPWSEASAGEVDAFLRAWQSSGWALKRTAYDALHQLVIAAWYANPRSWPAIGYPGPPSLAV